MNVKKIWECKLKLNSHIFWESKETFDLAKDRYSMWVLFALETGSFKYEIGEEVGVVKPNELVFCPPNTTLYRQAISSMSMHFITFKFDSSVSDNMVVNQIPSFKVNPTDNIRLTSNFSYLKMLNLTLNSQGIHRKQWMLNDLWLLACNEWEYLPKEEDLAGFSQTSDLLMNTAMDLLIKSADTPFNIKEISDSIGLSQVQFTRRFKRTYNIFPSDVVRKVRLRNTTNLLLNTDFTLEEIAERCGFNNGFYLSRVFKEHMGISPSQFRQQNKL